MSQSSRTFDSWLRLGTLPAVFYEERMHLRRFPDPKWVKTELQFWGTREREERCGEHLEYLPQPSCQTETFSLTCDPFWKSIFQNLTGYLYPSVGHNDHAQLVPHVLHFMNLNE